MVFIYLVYDAYVREIKFVGRTKDSGHYPSLDHLSDHKPLLRPITLTMNDLLCIKEVVKI